MEKEVEPTSSVATPPKTSSSEPELTPDQILKFYEDYNKGRWKGTEEEWEAFEPKLLEAAARYSQ